LQLSRGSIVQPQDMPYNPVLRPLEPGPILIFQCGQVLVLIMPYNSCVNNADCGANGWHDNMFMETRGVISLNWSAGWPKGRG